MRELIRNTREIVVAEYNSKTFHEKLRNERKDDFKKILDNIEVAHWNNAFISEKVYLSFIGSIWLRQ